MRILIVMRMILIYFHKIYYYNKSTYEITWEITSTFFITFQGNNNSEY